MPEEEENKPEEQQEQPKEEEPQGSNTAPTTEDLNLIKAELEEERKAKAAAEAALAEKDALVAQLQNHLSEAKKASEAVTAELTNLKDAHTKAVAKYLDAVKLANPTIPGDVISGSTIDEIDASLAKALTIAESVKKSLEAQAQEAKVPAGAPPRGAIPLDGLSPREKIIAGLKQTGGT